MLFGQIIDDVSQADDAPAVATAPVVFGDGLGIFHKAAGLMEQMIFRIFKEIIHLEALLHAVIDILGFVQSDTGHNHEGRGGGDHVDPYLFQVQLFLGGMALDAVAVHRSVHGDFGVFAKQFLAFFVQAFHDQIGTAVAAAAVGFKIVAGMIDVIGVAAQHFHGLVHIERVIGELGQLRQAVQGHQAGIVLHFLNLLKAAEYVEGYVQGTDGGFHGYIAPFIY